jgi:L-alanine-DL-glutamate epimerase-like enolase superfamily enzyme
MKIVDVRTQILRLPEVREIGDGCQTVLIVEVETDEGLIGIGEAHTLPVALEAIVHAPLSAVAARGLRELVLGQDPRDIGRLWDRMFRHSLTYGRRGLAIHALSAIDIALWDILGKEAGLPVWRLLGGARRTEVPVYASDLSQPTVEATLELAERHRDAGYRALKFGWGGLGADRRQDVATVAQLRSRVGPDVDLMIDMGFPVPLDDAIYLGHAFAEHGVYFLEEPLSPDDLRGFAKLVAASPTPIATGEKHSTEHDFLDLMDVGGLRILQPDVARVGGITETLRIAAHAEARNVRVIPHCWSTDILVAATLHVIAGLRDCPYLELNVTENPLRTDLLLEPIRPRDGVVSVPDQPGLGIELNPDTLERFRWEH